MTTLAHRMLTVLVPAALVLLLASPAWPTAQIPERIVYEQTEGFLFTEPLESYFTRDNPRPEFTAPHTACWRGYIGSWEIREDTLYLTDLKAWMRDKEGKAAPVGFEEVFPGKIKPLKAEWFTGTLRIPQGKPIHYVHMGYQTIYEYDVFLRIQAGKVVDRQMVDNRGKVRTNPPAPFQTED
jgi:hypothetical protein